jgi:hypothetical protein
MFPMAGAIAPSSFKGAQTAQSSVQRLVTETIFLIVISPFATLRPKHVTAHARSASHSELLKILAAAQSVLTDLQFEIEGVCAIRPMRLGAANMGLMLKPLSEPTTTEIFYYH